MSGRLLAIRKCLLHIPKFNNQLHFAWVIAFWLLAAASTSAQLPARDSSASRLTASCHDTEPTVDGATDVEGLKEYKEAIADLLAEQMFDDLDCLAHVARSEKMRFPGGLWKLHQIYLGLTEIPGHATDQDWTERISLLQRWASAKPSSITAHVALAEAYKNYAWAARGNGTADTVTGSGWNLFSERLDKAQAILDEAGELSEKCPEWYFLRQIIAKEPQETSLFNEAIAFEPNYYYYYRIHATKLLPKWYGADGDASAFVTQAADRLGGPKGDILYFQIASNLCPCDEPEFHKLSWERIQKGFAETESKYGVSASNLNSFALMAVNSNDYVAADAAFKRIGDQWDEDAWQTHQSFEANRDFAAKIGPMQARSRKEIQEATLNEQSPEGAAYKRQVKAKFILFVEQCAQQTDADLQKFDYLLLLGKDGIPQNGWSPQPTNIMGCLGKQFMTAQIRKEALFPPPPHDKYWVKFEVDPSVYNASK
jgi:hypothetical protein